MIFKICYEFLLIGMICFGGGYSILPLLQSTFIKKGWISSSEFIDMIAISQMTPGPIGANLATFVGFRLEGIAGAFLGTICLIIPGIILAIGMIYFYDKLNELDLIHKVFYGLRPVATGLILAAAINIMIITLFRRSDVFSFIKKIPTIDYSSLLLFLFCLVLLRKKVNYIYLLIISGTVGYFL
ncbi:MAG: chromate transporter [Candidatus Muirbacterium halophilum]|nr:chromate transporter [Candidatus Muirbacterium halophilum]MCK9474413.1 chromate transporter [Candidatus Muirbacterium halophilum]